MRTRPDTKWVLGTSGRNWSSIRHFRKMPPFCSKTVAVSSRFLQIFAVYRVFGGIWEGTGSRGVEVR